MYELTQDQQLRVIALREANNAVNASRSFNTSMNSMVMGDRPAGFTAVLAEAKRMHEWLIEKSKPVDPNKPVVG